jgi:hypothetical protein
MDDLPDPTSRVNGSQAPLTKGRAKRLKSPRQGGSGMAGTIRLVGKRDIA